MQYYSSNIADICEGKLQGPAPEKEVLHLNTDSRNVYAPDHALFIALSGPRHDGHDYIPEAYEKGIRFFMADDQDKVKALPPHIRNNCCILLVSNAVKALHKLAEDRRKRFKGQIIAITGSNGKTIVKEWLSYLLHGYYQIMKSPKSYNSQIGVPLSLWNLKNHHEIAIIEAGISRPGEMEKLEKLIKPDGGIFTNIGQAHQANFSNLKEKMSEKLKLFRNAKFLCFCSNHEELATFLLKQKNNSYFSREVQFITWGTTNGNYLTVSSINDNTDYSTLRADFRDQSFRWRLPFTDPASIENALHSAALAHYLNVPPGEIEESLNFLPGMEMRLEFKKGLYGSTIINDSYNLDPESLRPALAQLDKVKQHREKVLILSDMLETGNEAEVYKEIAGIVQEHNPDRFIGVGPAISGNKALFPEDGTYFESTDDLLKELDPAAFADCCILLKGARAFKFEEIDKQLRREHHNTRLEIDLDAMVENLNFFRKQVSNKTKIMVMVKAFSYGSGAAEVAALLEEQRVDCLGVAYADEGLELRRAGITLPVIVMNPEPGAFDAMITNNLEPVIYSFRMLNALKAVLNRRRRSIKVHIKVDTGMHRLGFGPDEADPLAKALLNADNVNVQSVFSHLAASDDPDEEAFTLQQVDLLKSFAETLKSMNIKPFMIHIANTAGIINYPLAHLDMVRLGLGLYGIDTSGKNELSRVLTYKTVVSQVKVLQEGDTVGYNRSGKLAQPGKIATLMLGYADGMKMSLSHGNGCVMINGKRAPVVGKVCMDMCMVDVTDIDIKEGDEAVVFGEGLEIEEIARNAGTIPYDILTGIPPRVKRVYFNR